ncbi:DMT family transporter [Parasedimentitalea marina]|uniref:DMT family transporter n=1 Tax=Parasedimentitalea marina TaxID=2483033 RepID=A0A3T0N527_9RHOB|nr:DMT family transporter [Parasedimentitalea marina]AZV79128.1 DMT family transporter [Parasedimentitalea marina]
MTHDHPTLGILLMLGFCIVAPLGDAVAKMLGGTIPLGELLFVRFAVQVALLVPLIWVSGRQWRMQGQVLQLTFLRTLLHISGIGAMFTALKYLPLTDAIAIAFVMPFIVLLLGKYLLGEEIGLRRLGACIVGFGGTLLVIQPSFAVVGWPALWPLLMAVIFSFFILVTRKIAKKTDPVGLQAVSGVMACLLLAPVLLIGNRLDIAALTLIMPDNQDWFLLMAIGVLGTTAHLLITWSLRYAPASTLASMQYLEIPVATLFGWMIFDQLPNTLASIGIAVTVSAGLYVILRERIAARQLDVTRKVTEKSAA